MHKGGLSKLPHRDNAKWGACASIRERACPLGSCTTRDSNDSWCIVRLSLALVLPPQVATLLAKTWVSRSSLVVKFQRQTRKHKEAHLKNPRRHGTTGNLARNYVVCTALRPFLRARNYILIAANGPQPFLIFPVFGAPVHLRGITTTLPRS